MLIKGLRWDPCSIRHTSLLAYIFNTGRHVSSRPLVMETSSHVLLGCLEEKGDPRPHMVFLQANALVRPLGRALTASGLQCFMAEFGGPGCGAQEGTGLWLALRCDPLRCDPEVSHDAPFPHLPVGSVHSSGKLSGQQHCWGCPAPPSFSRVSRRPTWTGKLTATFSEHLLSADLVEACRTFFFKLYFEMVKRKASQNLRQVAELIQIEFRDRKIKDVPASAIVTV